MARQLAERELTSEGPRRGPDSGPKPRRRSVTVNLAESPLSWLHARGHLSDRLFDAGERLRADYEKAQLSPSVTMRWDPVRIKGGPDAGLSPTERQMAAKERFDGAMREAIGTQKRFVARLLAVEGKIVTIMSNLDHPAIISDHFLI